MPRVEAKVVVPVAIDVAFAVSQTHGAVRLQWDPFIRSQHLLHGATTPAKGVQTKTVSRHHLRMVSEYVSFRAPHQVGMKMVRGPWFFATFAGGWTFTEAGDGNDAGGRTEAVWRYTFTVRPKWLAPIADRVGVRLLGRDIRRRIDAFAKACADPTVLAAVAHTT